MEKHHKQSVGIIVGIAGGMVLLMAASLYIGINRSRMLRDIQRYY